MQVTVIPIITGRLGTISKGLLRGLEEKEHGELAETIQTTALLCLARILRRVLKTYYHLDYSESSSAQPDEKIS